MEVASKPFSANSDRPTSSSWLRRSVPVIRTRRAARASSRRTSLTGRSSTAAGASGRPARASSGRDPPGGDALLTRPAHVVRPDQPLEQPDDLRAGVELPLQYAVPGRRRVGVVQVVPRLAHGQKRERPKVGRAVAGLERLVAEDVADRVDRPDHVCLLYTSDAADEEDSVDLGGRRII